MSGRAPRSVERTDDDRVVERALDSERLWLVVAFAAGAAVYVAYLSTHSHPAYEGGLFLRIAEVIRTSGYRFPRRVPGYTAGGVPFAYPPLGFYAMAATLDVVPVSPVALELYGPGLAILGSVVPYYALSRRLLPSVRQAGLATTVFVVTPPVLQWHISAGGVVRAPATFVTLVCLYTGLRTFRTHGWRWTLASTVAFALVVLLHPVYAVFCGATYLLLFAGVDRSPRGFLLGAVVAAGAAVLTAPWWLTVGFTHGFGTFLGATGTRTTLGGRWSRFTVQFVKPLVTVNAITPFYVLAFAGAAHSLIRRRYLLPAWLAASSYLLGEQRFTFFAGSMLTAGLVFERLVPTLAAAVSSSPGTSPSSRRRVASGIVVALVVLGSTSVGVAYAGSRLDTAHESSTALPQTVDAADREAMAWVSEYTTPSARFVVLGDSAEWFPYYTDRTILVAPWGTEWKGPNRFGYHLDRYTTLSRCHRAACLDSELDAVEGDADYLYVPKGEYTIRGAERNQSRWMRWSVVRSPKYELVHENRGVMVLRVRESRGGPFPPPEVGSPSLRVGSVGSWSSGCSPATPTDSALGGPSGA